MARYQGAGDGLSHRLVGELQEAIVRQLDAEDLASCCAVSRSLRQLASATSLWRSLCQRRWGLHYPETEEWDERRAGDRERFGKGYRGVFAAEEYHDTIVVDPSGLASDLPYAIPTGRRSHITVQNALAEVAERVCNTGITPRIVVLTGEYNEQLLVEDSVEIIGGGREATDVIIKVAQGTTDISSALPPGPASGSFKLIQWKATTGMLRNLCVEQPHIQFPDGTQRRTRGIAISAGSVEVSHCDVSCERGEGIDATAEVSAVSIQHSCIHGCATGITVSGTGHFRIHNNVFRDNNDAITLWRAGSDEQPVEITDNEILRNSGSGIGVHSQSTALVKNNSVQESRQSGIYFSDHSQGTVESNWISRSGMAGVSIKSYSSPAVRSNAILDGASAGVYIRDYSAGAIEDNAILRNAKAGIGIKQHASPRVVNNQISDGLAGGICIHNTASGTEILNNVIGPHGREALWIAHGAKVLPSIMSSNDTVSDSEAFLQRMHQRLNDAEHRPSEPQRKALLALCGGQSESKLEKK